MKIFDLTHAVTQDMPVFPGTEPPVIVEQCTIAEHGFREKKISLYSHTGTHVDAPSHMIPDGYSLDQFPIEKFHGVACVYTHDRKGGNLITIQHLKLMVPELEKADFLLIATGWDRYWGSEMYFSPFPVLGRDTAEWILQFGLKGIGLDVISADNMDSETFPVHHVLLGNGLVIVENLKNLISITSISCMFSCLPLNLQNADGAPVRAMAVVD
jgi:kynurenine formamidase